MELHQNSRSYDSPDGSSLFETTPTKHWNWNRELDMHVTVIIFGPIGSVGSQRVRLASTPGSTQTRKQRARSLEDGRVLHGLPGQHLVPRQEYGCDVGVQLCG